jgi:predicted O-methyltransferase YrrM
MQIAQEIYRSRTVETADGQMVPLHSEIQSVLLEALHNQVQAIAPDHALEVGLANGLSALGILSAMEATGRGHLTSIDPYQFKSWRGAGVTAVGRAGLEPRHTLINDFDYAALPALLTDGHRIQFAYIDGWHTFDYTLLDFFYADKMLDVGGVVGFNDCAWPAVRKALRFVVTHRSYEEIDVGLGRVRRGSHRTARVRARLQGRPVSDRYFRKTDDAEPRWDFFASF